MLPEGFVDFDVEEDGGIDIQRTNDRGLVVFEIGPDGKLRDLSITGRSVAHQRAGSDMIIHLL